MVKSTAVVLGFLFALSTAYYLSFWTSFDIDVFQYIAIEDIIKGIAYPLRFAGVWVLIIISFLIFVFTVAGIKEEAKSLNKVLLTLFLISIIAGLAFKYVSSTLFIGISFSVVLSLLLSIIYFALDINYEADKTDKKKKEKIFDEHPAIMFFNILTVYAFIFLPINAIIAGQVDAKDIHLGRKYNYIMTKDLPKDKVHANQPYLIFLGAVSEKYIFVDKGQNERFIIDKEEMQALRIHHYDESDSSSVEHLKICIATK